MVNAEVWNNSHVLNVNAQAHNIEVERNGKSETVNYDLLVLANGANTINAPSVGSPNTNLQFFPGQFMVFIGIVWFLHS